MLTPDLTNFEAVKTGTDATKKASGLDNRLIAWRCPYCAAMWVDRACADAGFYITNVERCRLVAALLSRQHLILSGPAGIGKGSLANALALSMAQEQCSHVRLIQGHPWWAVNTGNVAHYVNLQAEFSLWRLLDFVEIISAERQPLPQTQPGQNGQTFVACIERVSSTEIDFYFDVFSQWLLGNASSKADFTPLRLIGTYDGEQPLNLTHRILRSVALVPIGDDDGLGRT
jgi:hypothetical protein